MPVYRYRFTGVSAVELARNITNPVTIGASSPLFVDLTALSGDKPDLDDLMGSKGWSFESQDPLLVAAVQTSKELTAVVTGIAQVDFGTVGAVEASLVVTGQAGIVAGSMVQAMLVAVDTPDHLADEHWMENIKVAAGAIVPGVGFTLFAHYVGPSPGGIQDGVVEGFYGPATQDGSSLIRGKWSVGWRY